MGVLIRGMHARDSWWIVHSLSLPSKNVYMMKILNSKIRRTCSHSCQYLHTNFFILLNFFCSPCFVSSKGMSTLFMIQVTGFYTTTHWRLARAQRKRLFIYDICFITISISLLFLSRLASIRFKIVVVVVWTYCHNKVINDASIPKVTKWWMTMYFMFLHNKLLFFIYISVRRIYVLVTKASIPKTQHKAWMNTM